VPVQFDGHSSHSHTGHNSTKTNTSQNHKIHERKHKNQYICNHIMTSYLSNQMISSTHSDSIDADFSPQSATTSYVEDNLADLRPPAMFKKGYRALSPYENSSFAEVTLKKTKNGQRAKSGISLAYPISPSKRQSCW
jgi:hypothetical protein